MFFSSAKLKNFCNNLLVYTSSLGTSAETAAAEKKAGQATKRKIRSTNEAADSGCSDVSRKRDVLDAATNTPASAN